MRVLIVDQDSEMLESIARTFEVDVATSKATCVDLLRANPFDVLVACERLDDGSGLELLSHAAQRWPEVVRILAIEPERRSLLRGRLAPFKLFAAIRYPVDEDELEAVLESARDLSEPGRGVAVKPREKVNIYSRNQPPPRLSSSVTGAMEPSRGRARIPAAPVPHSRRGPVPLGVADDSGYRIVPREFDTTAAPLAARAVRVREQAATPRTLRAKLSASVRKALERLRKR